MEKRVQILQHHLVNFTLFLQPQDSLNDDNNNQESENQNSSQSLDIEDLAGKGPSSAGRPVATKRKRGQMSLESSLSGGNSQQNDGQLSQLSKSWKEVLGEPPKWGPNKVRLLSFTRYLLKLIKKKILPTSFHLNGSSMVHPQVKKLEPPSQQSEQYNFLCC